MMLTRSKRKILKYSFLGKPAFIIVLFAVILFLFIKFLGPVYNFLNSNNFNSGFVSEFVFNSPGSLKSTDGRTNLLILGIGDSVHDGPNLTDTMIFLSLDFKKKDAVMVSIPRDVYIGLLKNKINSAYAYGEAKKKGGGLILAKSVAEEVVGQPVHYGWVINFSGFKKLIDVVGGVDINIDRNFDDYHYPIDGKENNPCDGDPEFKCRYEHLHFDAGRKHMDGDFALKYVRSRYAEGDEGTDFARSQRQQKVILALKDKILHHSNFWDLSYDNKLFKALDDATDTDMNLRESLLLGRFFLSLNLNNIRRPVIDAGNENTGRKGFLINPPTEQFADSWVLIPRIGDGNFSEISRYIKCYIDDPACSMAP